MKKAARPHRRPSAAKFAAEPERFNLSTASTIKTNRGEKMVSRRNYVAITSMMLVVCLLLLLPQYIKNYTNPYTGNAYLADGTPSGENDAWRQSPLLSAADREKVKDYILYVGSQEDDTGYAVTSWAAFTKMPLAVSSAMPDVEDYGGSLPRMLILEAEACGADGAASLLEWNEKGVTVVFANLPPASQIKSDVALQKLLGILSVQQDMVELSAVRVFSGFLMGGERIYSIETEQDRELMDLNMRAPWFRLEAGTEVYILGDVPEEVLPQQLYRNEQLPALLWRHSLNGVNVFAVNGEYLSGNTGIGVLSAITAKDRAYYLYPIVNSQVMTVANFPGMAEENTLELTGRYGQGQVALNRDLLWPSVESMSVINDFPMSCFFMPQYQYSDEAEPDPELVPYYLKLLRERGSEAGISLQHAPDVILAEKWKRDAEYLSQEVPDYQYSAAFMTKQELDEFRAAPDAVRNLRSACVSLPGQNALFFFLNEQILCQTVTNDLLEHSFSQDLALNSLQTALGYSNVLLDLKRVSWPEEDEPGWERYYETYSSTLYTYWRRYDKFDRLTVSQSDERIRDFLCMDYSENRSGDTISLQISGFRSESGTDFILRTHLETVDAVEGGEVTELEQGVWLLHADEPEVRVKLRLDDRYEVREKE